MGSLWESYVIYEREKFNAYTEAGINSYFWRTYDQQELDLIEEKSNEISAYEIKWKNDRTKKPIAFEKAYPDAGFELINNKNYLEFITNKN